jgi:hypothetical protein
MGLGADIEIAETRECAWHLSPAKLHSIPVTSSHSFTTIKEAVSKFRLSCEAVEKHEDGQLFVSLLLGVARPIA